MAHWRHIDPDLSARAERYLERAEAGFVGSGERDPARDAAEFRAYLVARSYQIARLIGSVGINGQAAVIVPYPGGPQPADRMTAARDLYAPLRALARASGLRAPLGDLETEAVETDAAGLPVIAVAVIAVASVAAVGLLANQAALVVDRYLERDQQTQRLAMLDASAHKAVERHIQREDQAKRSLPLDEATRQQLAELGRAANELAKAKSQPLPSVLDSSALKLPAFGVAGGAVILAAAAAAFLFLHRK